MREAGAWAAVKLDYLARYIDVFETSMRQKWPVRWYIDLLAGPGKNKVRETGAILLGSPLLALTTRHPFTSYFFADLSAANTEVLRQRCMASPCYGQVDVCTGDCNHLVNDIVSHIMPDNRRSLNLAFLDPEGLELRWETVDRLAAVRRMDLIINYPEGGLNRYMRRAAATAGPTSVDDFFGSRAWRAIYQNWQDGGRSRGLHRQLIDLYKQRLQDLGYREVLRADQLGEEPLIRSGGKRLPLYRLLSSQ
jgi:three-Cys-motif partner protein